MNKGTRAKVLVVMPTMWDRRQLDACRNAWCDAFEVEFDEPSDVECPADFPIIPYIHERAARRDIAGVFSSSDYPGATVAAAIATEAGLPGSRPEHVLAASHKLTSRRIQREAVPDATAKFCLVDPTAIAAPQIGFPCFVKPIKGAFSMFARRIDSMDELEAHLARPEVAEFCDAFLAIFNDLWSHYADGAVDGRYFIAEELLTGALVTVEGFVADGEAEVIGVVDSELHPGANSFSRFVYPSALPQAAQARMADVARRCVAALGLQRTFFNIEMMWDGTDARIIEVNPRICGQFGDLYEKVDGTNTFAVALALAAGEPVTWRRGAGRHAVAASVPLRVFEPTHVRSAPDASRVAEIEARFSGTLVWPETASGDTIADFAHEDGVSFRYAVVNLGADSREALAALQSEVVEALGFDLAPLPAQD